MNKKLVIAAGGTGGHIYPAIAVADCWQQLGGEVAWLGTQSGLEAEIVPKHNLSFYTLQVNAIRGKGWLAKCCAVLKLLKAIVQAIKLLRRIKPDVVLGMGGYVSGPGAIAAWLLRIPLVIHEQNSIMGKTNKLLLPFAKRVLCAFPNSQLQIKPSKKIVFNCGNPVRQAFNQIPVKIKEQDCNNQLNILVIGGSRGARILNVQIPEILSQSEFDAFNLHIKHQAGEKTLAEAKHSYACLHPNANQPNQDQDRAKPVKTIEIMPYIDDMAEAFAWADMIIARAGAMTVFEVIAAARPCVFIPYDYAVDDHQTVNAQYLTQKSAAYLVPESHLRVENIFPIVQTLYLYAEQYNEMVEHLLQCKPKAQVDKYIAEQCLALC